jgi:hypothetical protein
VPPVAPPGAPSVKQVFSAVVDPNQRDLHLKAGLEVDGQFVGIERSLDL